MEEITSPVTQSASAARQETWMAGLASAVATLGSQVVSNVVSPMGDIETASGKIGDIISVIDGIAFRIKSPALNAAVEAARAGEQGRAALRSLRAKCAAQRGDRQRDQDANRIDDP